MTPTDLPQVLDQLQQGTFAGPAEEFEAMRGGGRPSDGKYYLDDGVHAKERVPAVTTVKDCLHPRGLFWWYWQKGKDGYDFDAQPTAAAEIGTFVHRKVDAFLHDLEQPTLPPALEEEADKIDSSYGAFRTWWAAGKFKMLATEVPLISTKHRYGGTPDAILLDADDRVCMGDWKSSNALYWDYLVQIASYGQLWNENAPERLQLRGGFHIIRFAKTNGDFEHRHFPDLEDALEMFMLLRTAYDLKKQLERRIK